MWQSAVDCLRVQRQRVARVLALRRGALWPGRVGEVLVHPLVPVRAQQAERPAVQPLEEPQYRWRCHLRL
jgi:hypothetical protein